MKNLQENKTESVTVRLNTNEAQQLQQEAQKELLSLSGLIRRKLFMNPIKATV